MLLAGKKTIIALQEKYGQFITELGYSEPIPVKVFKEYKKQFILIDG